jgi:tRNA(Ile)-lysidine synthase
VRDVSGVAPALEPIAADEADAAFSGLDRYDVVVACVSGGADSTALLHLLADWAARRGLSARLLVVTVDHGLRPEAGAEARAVAAAAASLGLAHVTQTYSGPFPETFAQAWARELRYRLIAEAAHARLGKQGRAAIVTAHHRDDQAETVLMRLARGSGVDGLAGMRPLRRLDDRLDLVRPLLGFAKARLEATLRARGVAWAEDPSNSNERFERVRLRAHLSARDQLGLSSQALARVAVRAARAAAALDTMARTFVESAAVAVDGLGFVGLDWDVLNAQPEDIRLRVLALLIRAVGGQDELSLSGLEAFTVGEDWVAPTGRTFGHCAFLTDRGNSIRIVREEGRAAPPPHPCRPLDTLRFDNRFDVHLGADLPDGLALHGLTRTGVRQAQDQGGTRPSAPIEALATLPGLWRGPTLVSAPAFGIGQGLMTVAPFRLLRNGT